MNKNMGTIKPAVKWPLAQLPISLVPDGTPIAKLSGPPARPEARAQSRLACDPPPSVPGSFWPSSRKSCTCSLLLGRWKRPLSGKTSLETHRRGRSLRQVRRKTSLQTHRRPGNRAPVDAIASVCAAGRWTGRQSASLRGGQGGNLRRCKVGRAPICVGPKAPSGGLPARIGASTVILAKRASGPYPLSAKKIRSWTGGDRAGEGRGRRRKKGSSRFRRRTRLWNAEAATIPCTG
jgi:hypothetical protein